MRKLLIIIGFGGLFSALILALFLSGNLLGRLQKDEYVRAKYIEKANAQVLDEDYMDFYELEAFDTELPVIFIDTYGSDISDEEPVISKVSILNSKDDGHLHNISEVPDLALNAGVKYRGASSNNFDKRQYRIVFYKDPTGAKKLRYDLLGMGAADSWVLNGPFLDKTLARNYLVYTLGSQIMEWAPECKYVELFVNGQYRGVYLAVEPVSQGVGRLDLSDYALLSGKTAYIVGRDREGSDIKPLQNFGKINGYTSNNLYVEYPGIKNITEVEYEFITDDISVFEMALYGDDFANEKNGYASYIDVDNFVDYYILNEVVMNHDAGNLSTYAYKEINGKLKMAIWDFNNCYDNFACQSMLGLISDNEPEHIERAGRYLNWHTNALLNEDGYITNYSMKNGALVSDEKADSFDSYAAEYILLLSEYLGRGGDPEVIGDWKEAVQLLADRFDEVTRFDVTYVNRKFRVAYLMDNTEVWEAADSLGRLLTTKKEYRSDPEFNALGRRYLSISYALKHSIPEKFYLKEENYYTVGIDGEGNNTGSPDLDDFYPDAVAQLYPAVTGFLAVKSKERELYEKVCDYHDWEKDRIEDTTFEWSVMAYAAAVHKDEERLMAYIETYRSFTEKKRSYPMHTANAGWIMRACNRAIDDLRNKKDTGFMNYIKWIFEEDR